MEVSIKRTENEEGQPVSGLGVFKIIGEGSSRVLVSKNTKYAIESFYHTADIIVITGSRFLLYKEVVLIWLSTFLEDTKIMYKINDGKRTIAYEYGGQVHIIQLISLNKTAIALVAIDDSETLVDNGVHDRFKHIPVPDDHVIHVKTKDGLMEASGCVKLTDEYITSKMIKLNSISEDRYIFVDNDNIYLAAHPDDITAEEVNRITTHYGAEDIKGYTLWTKSENVYARLDEFTPSQFMLLKYK